MDLLPLFQFMHYLGIAYGVGGATIAKIITTKADKNQELVPATMKILPSISKLIWLGLILLAISGVALIYLVKWPINRQLLLVKHVLVLWILIFGILISAKGSKLMKLIPKAKEKPSLEFLKTKKQMKVFSTINLILWYLVTIISVLL